MQKRGKVISPLNQKKNKKKQLGLLRHGYDFPGKKKKKQVKERNLKKCWPCEWSRPTKQKEKEQQK